MDTFFQEVACIVLVLNLKTVFFSLISVPGLQAVRLADFSHSEGNSQRCEKVGMLKCWLNPFDFAPILSAKPNMLSKEH